MPIDVTDFADSIAEKDDAPCDYEDYHGAYGGGEVGVDVFDAYFGEYGCQCGEEG